MITRVGPACETDTIPTVLTIDWLPNAYEHRPSHVVRLHGFDSDDLIEMSADCIMMADGAIHECPLHGRRRVNAVNGIQLVYRRGRRSRGLIREADSRFILELDKEGWQQAASLISPLLDNPRVFQWLSHGPDARLLVSQSGGW